MDQYIHNDDAIVLKGIKTHNLKNISLLIPRNALTVITGPSGSGKSSLAFDTIYAEGQRRYIESLSSYARQFLTQHSKPEIDSIEGLSPTISIEQKTVSYSPRSTVGTITEVYDYLRLLFSKVGTAYCWNCNNEIRSQSRNQIVNSILSEKTDSKVTLYAPIAIDKKGEFTKELDNIRQKGFIRAKIDGGFVNLEDSVRLDKNKKHTIFISIDRFIIKEDKQALLLRVSESVDLALKIGSSALVMESTNNNKTIESLYSEKFACTNCNISYPDPEPRSFSFNSKVGACPECEGLGYTLKNEEKTVCKLCTGARLKKEALYYKINNKNIYEISCLTIDDCFDFFDKLKLTKKEILISERVLFEVKERLRFLKKVGAGYLSAQRSSDSLSGGETQRIRLASQIGSSLVGVVYILDEPSIGLHPKDNHKLIESLIDIKNRGNTVLVVEHDEETMLSSDWLIDMGPGAGRLGGFVVASGPVESIKKSKSSLTGQYLSRKKKIASLSSIRKPTEWISINKVNVNNISNLDVKIPIGVLTCVTGVSGSGKSSLILETLLPSLQIQLFTNNSNTFINCKSINGHQKINKVINVDQSPIGRTPRSNPSTYCGVFSIIRSLYASLPQSQIRGFGPGHFSFNVKGGRCESCQGDGLKKIEMHFLPNVFVECDVCLGKRYHNETLQILYKGKSIADVLNMTISESLEFFESVPRIKHHLQTLVTVGLGYIQLGQSATTLSGGEAQRLKLATELTKRDTGNTLYILDEPSTGLHFEDISRLNHAVNLLVEKGNTVIIIEHNLDIIKTADYVIDMGPEGGRGGGRVVAIGTPEEVSKNKNSVTGLYLSAHIKRG